MTGLRTDECDRYAGKPMLRLLELYVLWSIDQLSDESENPQQFAEMSVDAILH